MQEEESETGGAMNTFKRIEASEEFHYEAAKVEFAIELGRLIRASGVKKSVLADRMGVRRPMISKLLRGDANVTIETMVKAARALGSKLHIKLAPEGTHVLDVARIEKAMATRQSCWVIPANQVSSENCDEAQSLAA
jgi:plasmid maintenance system antidote protein VapI